MDVFAITCRKHICYVEADGNGSPFCPIGHRMPDECGRDWWNIFQSDNHMMELTDHVRTAIFTLNGLSNRLNAQIRPTPKI